MASSRFAPETRSFAGPAVNPKSCRSYLAANPTSPQSRRLDRRARERAVSARLAEQKLADHGQSFWKMRVFSAQSLDQRLKSVSA